MKIALLQVCGHFSALALRAFFSGIFKLCFYIATCTRGQTREDNFCDTMCWQKSWSEVVKMSRSGHDIIWKVIRTISACQIQPSSNLQFLNFPPFVKARELWNLYLCHKNFTLSQIFLSVCSWKYIFCILCNKTFQMVQYGLDLEPISRSSMLNHA